MDEYGIVANVESDRAFRTGAKVWVLLIRSNLETAKCSGLNKAGRPITKHIPLKRLTNFRSKWMPEYVRPEAYLVMTKDEAVNYSTMLEKRWRDVRYFDRNGELLKDGKSIIQAFTETDGIATANPIA